MLPVRRADIKMLSFRRHRGLSDFKKRLCSPPVEGVDVRNSFETSIRLNVIIEYIIAKRFYWRGIVNIVISINVPTTVIALVTFLSGMRVTFLSVTYNRMPQKILFC